MGDAFIEAFLRAVEVEVSFSQRVVLDAGFRNHRVQALHRVHAELELTDGVDSRPLLGALAQKQPAPPPHVGIGAQLQPQRLIRLEQGFPQDSGRLGRGPGVGVGGGDEAGVGETGLRGGLRLAVDDRHLVAVFGQVVRGRHPDNAGAEDENLHWQYIIECRGKLSDGSFTGA